MTVIEAVLLAFVRTNEQSPVVLLENLVRDIGTPVAAASTIVIRLAAIGQFGIAPEEIQQLSPFEQQVSRDRIRVRVAAVGRCDEAWTQDGHVLKEHERCTADRETNERTFWRLMRLIFSRSVISLMPPCVTKM